MTPSVGGSRDARFGSRVLAKALGLAADYLRAAALRRHKRHSSQQMTVLNPHDLEDIGVTQSDVIFAKCAPKPPKRHRVAIEDNAAPRSRKKSIEKH